MSYRLEQLVKDYEDKKGKVTLKEFGTMLQGLLDHYKRTK